MNKVKDSLLVSIVVNIFIIVMEIVAGFIGNSISLISSGIHGVSDLITDIFSLIGSHFSSKPANKDYPFGYGKADNIFSMVIGIFIVFIGFFMLKSVFGESATIPSVWLVVVIFISMLVRYICSNYLMHCGLKYNSEILISNAKEGKIDALSSFFLLFVIILSQFSNDVSWFKYLDLVGGILISVIVIYVGFNIIHHEFGELIGRQEKNTHLARNIKNYILKDNDIKKVENINLLKFGSTYLVIFAIFFDKNISLKDADLKRNFLEDSIKKKYKSVNTIILKMHFEGDD